MQYYVYGMSIYLFPPVSPYPRYAANKRPVVFLVHLRGNVKEQMVLVHRFRGTSWESRRWSTMLPLAFLDGLGTCLLVQDDLMMTDI